MNEKTTSNNATQDDREQHLIYDVLDVIFNYLSINTLCKVALVSKSWNHVAMRQMVKRRKPSLVLLPVLYDAIKPHLDVGYYFNAKPDTLLLFCGPQLHLRPALNVEYKIMMEYYKRLSSCVILLSVDQMMMDTKEVHSCNTLTCYMYDPPVTRSILGLSLPESEHFTNNVVQCLSIDANKPEKAVEVFSQLHRNAEHLENPIFLLFGRKDYAIGPNVLRLFRDKYPNKAINLWGGMVGDFIKHSDDGYPDDHGSYAFLGILLHAPRLQAHCLVLPIDNDTRMFVKLSDFQRSFQLKRRKFGLISGPRQFVHLNSEVPLKHYFPVNSMGFVKSQFPTVKFTGIFNDSTYSNYGCDHTTKDENYKLEHRDALSIMIITYD